MTQTTPCQHVYWMSSEGMRCAHCGEWIDIHPWSLSADAEKEIIEIEQRALRWSPWW